MEQQERIRIVVVDNDIQKKRKRIGRNCSKNIRRNSRIKVLQIKENGGFSYANNQGYQYAREHFGKSYIVVLNNDIEFTQKDFISRLEQSYQNNQCYILGPDVIRQSTGEHQNPMDTRLRTKEEAEYTIKMNRLALRLLPHYVSCRLPYAAKAEKNKLVNQEKQLANYSQSQKDIVPFGACLIFTPLFVEKEEKAFEPETQFFYEEYILTLRCQQKGYNIVYDPSMSVKHESGAATKKSYGTEKKRIRFMMEKTAGACEVYLEMLGERQKSCLL